MNRHEITEVGMGLLAHLHLSASQATVMLDDSTRPSALVVYIYDPDATRRVKAPASWNGYNVSLVTGMTVSPN